ncbi:hypothetical protein FHX74_001205 [Friedmanniella endophytica]|uniref:MinD-like ATPase involved in chromosome partitioning or flagellar assembly n=1 Tax=Microlunatus kandeliicorticis TaxID=1759536 RepID=A0A7W3IQZ8_9ACTN|nr:hypothetical protein [Microlunatus kandeliicorticis]
MTTLALGLALTWPRSVILVDADPSASQAVLAGFLGGQVRTGKGLLRVAEGHRDRRPLREVVSDQTVPLADDPATSRRLLPGFVRPGNAALFEPVWPELAETFVRFGDSGIDVVVDLGRLGAGGVPQALLERADVCALVTRSSLRALAAARWHGTQLAEQARLAGGGDLAGVVVIGEGRPYRSAEIAALLGLPVLSTVPDDPESAAALVDGGRRSRRFDTAPLPRALPHVGAELQARIGSRSDRLDDGAAAAPRPSPTEPVGVAAVPGSRR